jgi:hypothetical protein
MRSSTFRKTKVLYDYGLLYKDSTSGRIRPISLVAEQSLIELFYENCFTCQHRTLCTFFERQVISEIFYNRFWITLRLNRFLGHRFSLITGKSTKYV